MDIDRFDLVKPRTTTTVARVIPASINIRVADSQCEALGNVAPLQGRAASQDVKYGDFFSH